MFKNLLAFGAIAALSIIGGANIPKFSDSAVAVSSNGTVLSSEVKLPVNKIDLDYEATDYDIAAVSAKQTGSEPNITAKAAILLEANSGKVLYSKDETKHLPIASMVKIMTLAVIYDALEAGQIKLDDDVMISRNANGMGGSQAFLDFDSTYKVSELIKSIVVASANDSCVAMAEHLYGSEADFVDKMNELASRLGMTNTNFVNCTGLPTVGAYSCAADVAKMYAHIMKSPFYGKDQKIWMYDLEHPSGRVTGLTNTNKHARFYPNCEGGKTGFTAEAGHCIAVTAERKNLRPVAVIIGASDSKTRFAESAALMNHTFDAYENKLIVNKDKPIGQIKLQKAWDSQAEVYAKENVYDLCKKGDKDQPTVNIELQRTVKAPIAKDAPVGVIIVTEDGKVIGEVDAVTGKDISRLTYLDAVKKAVNKFKI